MERIRPVFPIIEVAISTDKMTMDKPARILLIEDDPKQSEWIAEEVIWNNFPDAEILFFDSEYSFIQSLETNKIHDWKPQHAIMDLLVRYYSMDDFYQNNGMHSDACMHQIYDEVDILVQHL